MSISVYSSGDTLLFLNLGDEPASVTTVESTEVYCHSTGKTYSYAWCNGWATVILHAADKLTPAELERIVTGVKVSKK